MSPSMIRVKMVGMAGEPIQPRSAVSLEHALDGQHVHLALVVQPEADDGAGDADLLTSSRWRP